MLLQQGSGRDDERIPAHQYLRSIQVELTTQSAWRATVVLYDPEGDFLENLITTIPVADRVVKMRWGWDQGAGVRDMPLFAGTIIRWEPTFNEQGVELAIEVLSSAVTKVVLDKAVRSFPAGMKVSDIVRQIATARNWTTQDSVGRNTIEDSDRALDKPIALYDESDFKFITDQLLPLAATVDGEPFEHYFNRDEVHFHSKGFLARQRTPVQVAKTYTFARDVRGEVISFSPQNAVVFAHISGASDAVYTFVDERLGERIEIETTKDGGEDIRIVAYPNEKAVSDTGTKVKARIPIPARSTEEGKMLVRAAYGKKRQQSYAAQLEVRGTHEFDIADFIEVKYLTRSGREHYLSGMFYVLGISHQIDAGSWTMSVTMNRAGEDNTEDPSPNSKIEADKKQAIQTKPDKAFDGKAAIKAKLESVKGTKVRDE
jgi:hypothetical protein